MQSLELDITIGEGIPRLAVLDAGRAKQVITNTVGNAIKAWKRWGESPQHRTRAFLRDCCHGSLSWFTVG